MRKRNQTIWLVLVLFMALALLPAPAPGAKPSEFATAAGIMLKGFGALPLRFEINCGQTAGRFLYVARGRGYNLFLGVGEALLVFHSAEDQSASETGGSGAANGRAIRAVRVEFVGADPMSQVRGVDPLPGPSHYLIGSNLIGSNGAQWLTDVQAFAGVSYKGVYPGIDLVFYGRQGEVEFDFAVAPGASAEQIRMRFEGADQFRITPEGDLVLGPGSGALRFRKPVCYQKEGKVPVVGGYAVKGPGEAGFHVGAYEASQALVIDPVLSLSYSTYLGGADTDRGDDIAIDPSGNAYITGRTISINFPTANPLQSAKNLAFDAFVAKLNASGASLGYATYLGGGSNDEAHAIAVDGDGQAYVAGITNSVDFPVQNPFQGVLNLGTDVFVAKLSASGGSLVYSTYFGGGENEEAFDIAVNSAGQAFVAGATNSVDFPIQNPFQGVLSLSKDAFVAKFSALGDALVYSTYLGGGSNDEAYAIAVGGDGRAYVTGRTASLDFPTQNPFQDARNLGDDAFVTKFGATGETLEYSTYLGGGNNDQANDIAVDAAGNAYVTGTTRSIDFPTSNAFQPAIGFLTDAFVTKLSITGSAIEYSTYLGGGNDDEANGIAVDAAGSAYIVGTTLSVDFPTLDPLQPELGAGQGLEDAFVTKFQPDGLDLEYSTYLGGGSQEEGMAIVVDGSENVYVAGITGSIDFPTRNALQPELGNGISMDAFVAKIVVDESQQDNGDGVTATASGGCFVTAAGRE